MSEPRVLHQNFDEAVERWLREEVAPTYDAMQASPERPLPGEAVFAALRAKHAARIKGDL